MISYAGKNIWVIGASTGIGKALAKELSDKGATLALSARSEDKLSELNQELGGMHHVVPFDVSDLAACKNATQKVEDAFPNIDSVVFLAAIYSPTKVEDINIEDAHKMVDVNFKGALNVVHLTLPIFEKQKHGQIVLCASVAAYRGLPGGQPYSATKAAVLNLAESLRAEKQHEGFDVKVINPGFVRTPLTDKNDFKMPMIIEPEDAASVIAKEMQSKRFEIHFPKRFTYIVKLLSILPAWLFFKCVPRF